MKIDTKKVSYDGRWFDYGDAELQIRPLPASRTDVLLKNGAFIVSGENTAEMFDYCLMGHKRLTDADDKPLKLTAEVKKLIFDFQMGEVNGESMATFVLRQARLMMKEIEADLKNFPAGQSGISPSPDTTAGCASPSSVISAASPATE